MNLRQYILTNNECYQRGSKITIKKLMVHSTATPNVSANFFAKAWNVFRPNGSQVCVHAFCDDKEIVQTLPWNHRAWHCGGTANNYAISVEMCEPKNYNDAAYFKKAKQNMIELFAYLCRKYNLSVNDIISHKEGHALGIASNHGDPDHWWKYMNYTMDDFRRDVAKRLQGTIIQSGTFVVTASAIKIRKQPSLKGKYIGVCYHKGSTVNYDQCVIKEGYKWISWIGNSGNRRWMAAGEVDSKGNIIHPYGVFR